MRLYRQSDEQMKGLLSRSGEDPEGIFIDINRDHMFVQEALHQKPVNQMALNFMIAYEVATILVENSQLASKTISKDILSGVEGYEGSDRVRMLERAILDNISPKKKVGRPPKEKKEET